MTFPVPELAVFLCNITADPLSDMSTEQSGIAARSAFKNNKIARCRIRLETPCGRSRADRLAVRPHIVPSHLALCCVVLSLNARQLPSSNHLRCVFLYTSSKVQQQWKEHRGPACLSSSQLAFTIVRSACIFSFPTINIHHLIHSHSQIAAELVQVHFNLNAARFKQRRLSASVRSSSTVLPPLCLFQAAWGQEGGRRLLAGFTLDSASFTHHLLHYHPVLTFFQYYCPTFHLPSIYLNHDAIPIHPVHILFPSCSPLPITQSLTNLEASPSSHLFLPWFL